MTIAAASNQRERLALAYGCCEPAASPNPAARDYVCTQGFPHPRVAPTTARHA